MISRRFSRGAAAPDATLAVPGDKSLSHRALILAAMASGTSEIRGLGPGRDVAATIACLRRLGVAADAGRVDSPGIAAWQASPEPLDAANSGTTMRLLTGALAGRTFASVLVGDPSLSRRPMARLVAPLAALGARITVSEQGTPPIRVAPASLRGAAVTVPVASAQVRTAVALAALQADGATTITSPPGYRDHTERWLTALGLGTPTEAEGFTVHSGMPPPLDLTVPGDPSSAAFLWTAAALAGGAVTTPGVSLNPGRTGFLDILEAMGITVSITPGEAVLGDPVGTVRVAGRPTRTTVVEGALVARSLDELPLFALLAAITPGISLVRHAGELRVKESDRIAATVALVRALGGDATGTDDGFVVTGGSLAAGTVVSHGDHRIAMAGAVAAAAAGWVEVEGWDASAVSWPGFEETWEALWS